MNKRDEWLTLKHLNKIPCRVYGTLQAIFHFCITPEAPCDTLPGFCRWPILPEAPGPLVKGLDHR